MTALASIVVSFGCSVSLLYFVAVPSAGAPARVFRPEPEDLSDFPFEFSTTKGSKVTADNVLVQSVASEGDTVFETNKPQPIKKYQSTAGGARLRDDDDDDDEVVNVQQEGNADGGGGGKKNNRPKVQQWTAKPTAQQWTAKPTVQQWNAKPTVQQWNAKPTKMTYSFSGDPSTMGGSQYVTTVYRHPTRRETASTAVVAAAAAADDDDDVVVVPSSVPVPSVGSQWDIVQNLYKYIYPTLSGIRIAYINK